MTTHEAAKLIRQWPQRRDVPRLLKEGIDAAKGEEKERLGQMAEALFAESMTSLDVELVNKYFGIP